VNSSSEGKAPATEASGIGPTTAEECRHIFQSIPAFAALTDEDIDALVPLLQAHDYPAGATLFYEDDEPNAAFFIASGAVEVFKSNQSGKKMPLVVLRDSGLLGEIGLLTGEVRTATARALNPVRVLELRKDAFEKALAEDNIPVYRLSLAFARVLSSRLVTTDEKLFELFQNDVSDLLYKQLSELQARLLTRWTA
jgi:CRP-like cAMP-binding protein